MRRRECKLFITSVTCRLSTNQWTIGPTSHDAYFKGIFDTAVTTSGTLRATPGTGLLVDRSVAVSK